MKTCQVSPIKSRHSHNSVPAFTLVELLVVIGIIAVLIGVLLPALNKARAQSQSVACLSNMRQLGQALTMFSQEHKGFLPKAWFNARPKATAPGVGPGGRDGQTQDYQASDAWGYRFPMYGWDYVLLRYVNNNKQVFACQSDTDYQLRGVADFGLPADQLPDKPDADDIPASYRINTSDIPDKAFTAIKISQLRKPAQSIVLLEGAHAPPPSTEPFHHVARWEDDQSGTVGPKTKKNVAWDRHAGKRSNYVFADGHAESMNYDDTWKPIGPNPWSPTPSLFYNNATMWRQRYDVPVGRTTPWNDTVQ